MKLSIAVLLFIAIVWSCSNDKRSGMYASKGSILLFDTASGRYKVSSSDKKLIKAWESFRLALLESDQADLESWSSDSIICPSYSTIICPECRKMDEHTLMVPAGRFYKYYSTEVFGGKFISSSFDSSNVRARYDWDNSYFDAYPFLLNRSDMQRPKIAEIMVSYPLTNGQYEGTTAILTFIETSSGFKFLEYWTIP